MAQNNPDFSVRIAVYEDENCYKIFKREEPITFTEHCNMVVQVIDLLRSQGISASSVTIDFDLYMNWLMDNDLTDSTEIRARYVSEKTNG